VENRTYLEIRFQRAIVSLAAITALITALHFLRFGAPEFDPKSAWILSDQNLYHRAVSESQAWAMPEPGILQSDDFNSNRFIADKTPGTIRIFCVGQSTTEGLPFEPRGGYPEWLGLMLKDVLPDRKIEVINAAVTASDSARDLSIVKELLGYKPDAIVLYEGNNEGLIAPFRVAEKKIGKLTMTLMIKTQRYFPVFRYLAGTWSQRQQGFPQEYVDTLYQANVKEMIGLARRHGVRIVVVGQVSTSALASGADRNNAFLSRQESDGAVFVDSVRVFRQDGEKCRAGIPECLVDNVHPSLRGYRLLALAIVQALSARGWIAPKPDWNWARLPDDALARRTIGLSQDFLARAYYNEAKGAADSNNNIALWATDYLKKSEKLRPGCVFDWISEESPGSTSPTLLKIAVKIYSGIDKKKAAVLDGIRRKHVDSSSTPFLF
jgi:lysophospholipase L1-like esterase